MNGPRSVHFMSALLYVTKHRFSVRYDFIVVGNSSQ
ncbi:unnamed protein product [Schistosoma mattheei]|uniref:Uncharacterized protein n=1 Tax=Schistosoma mattheei TaxID=31246 RepID=A0A183PXK4_9TREM|nr:unnamed protein product [Schistosoma mattheei]